MKGKSMMTSMKIDVPLSTRQVRFLEAIAMGNRPAKAATLAGYSLASGVHLIRNPAIRAAIRAIGANLDYVREQLKRHPVENERVDA
jgi:hypothetical protein